MEIEIFDRIGACGHLQGNMANERTMNWAASEKQGN